MNATSTLSRCAQILAAALVLTGSNAMADSSYTLSSIPFTVSGSVSSGSPIGVTFAGFDTSLGTLTSVTIQLTNVVVTGNATLTANMTGQEVFSAQLQGLYHLTDSLGDTVNANVLSADGGDHVVGNGATYYVLADPNNGLVSPPAAPPTGAQNISSTPQNGTADVITSSGALSFFSSSTGTVTLGMYGNNTLNSSTSGQFTTTVTGTGTGDILVTYTYTAAVPEPSKTAAIMIGFALFVLVGRNYFRGRGIRLA